MCRWSPRCDPPWNPGRSRRGAREGAACHSTGCTPGACRARCRGPGPSRRGRAGSWDGRRSRSCRTQPGSPRLTACAPSGSSGFSSVPFSGAVSVSSVYILCFMPMPHDTPLMPAGAAGSSGADADADAPRLEPIVVLTEREIRSVVALDLQALAAIEDAFTRLADGQADVPPIVGLFVPRRRGEVDVKAAYIHGLPSLAVKIASGFFDNSLWGLPSGSGLMVVLSTRTGFPQAIL